MSTLIVLLAVSGAITAAPVDHYASRYDHLDVDTILNNRRMVNYYAACLLSQGPCPPQGLEFKRILPEALQTNCVRCTEKQKTVTYRSIRRLKKEYPKIWDQLANLWDPEDVFVRKFEESFQSGAVPTTDSSAVPLANRFGDVEPSAPYPPAPSTTTPSTTTSTTTTTTISTTTTTKPTNPPTKTTTRAPPFRNVGTNLQATVTFMAAIKKIVIQLYQHKLDVLNRILSGR